MTANPRSSLLAGAGTSIEFDDVNDWVSGFVASVTVKNTSGQALSSWKLEFELSQTITNLWNGVVVSHVGTHYMVTNAAWNGTVAPGGTATFGFQADRGNPVLPLNALWNGTPAIAADAAPTPTPGTTPTPTPPPTPALLPSLSVAGASVHETTASTQTLVFTVKLSSASASTVTVAFATKDGTAVAGRDYDAAQGTLSFAPGVTSTTVAVVTHPGTQATEALTLVLSSPMAATLAVAAATGTITNPAPPTISAAGATVHLAPVSSASPAPTSSGAGALLPAGFLHTQGNQIVDGSGQDVRIAAVNWFGMETSTFAPHGLWTASYKTMMQQMVQQGFNAIRLPFSEQLFAANSIPNGIDFSKNPDLQGLTGLQIMDKIVDYASQIGLKIILDHHRSSAGGGPNENGLWYGGGGYTEQSWISTWTMLAAHYAGNSTVIGGDLANEPHGAATWGDGSVTDWAAAATRAGDAIQAVNPNWLIIVEGVQNYNGQSTWWGGNLQGVLAHPVTLTQAGHVVYSPHDYPSTVSSQSWFNDPNYPANLPAVWDQEWGNIAKSGTAPIFVGEFGTKLATTSDQQWLSALVNYMDTTGSGSGGQQGLSWAYWSWNPDSGDTGGILQDDWSTVNTAKVSAIQPAEYHPATAASGGGSSPVADGVAAFTVSLSAAYGVPVTVHYATVDGTAHSGADYAPISGDLTFAPGDTSKIVSTQLFATPGETGQMTFALNLSSPQNASLSTAAATATLIHDTTPTPLPTPTPTPVTAPTPTATGASVLLSVDGSWSGGYQEGVKITAGASPLNGWKVQFTTADVIGNLWNGTIVSHQGNSYVIGNASYNGAVGAGASVSFGFVVDHSNGDGVTSASLAGP